MAVQTQQYSIQDITSTEENIVSPRIPKVGDFERTLRRDYRGVPNAPKLLHQYNLYELDHILDEDGCPILQVVVDERLHDRLMTTLSQLAENSSLRLVLKESAAE